MKPYKNDIILITIYNDEKCIALFEQTKRLLVFLSPTPSF